MDLQFAKHENVSLKDLPGFNEAWLQNMICDDPSILGLGDIDVLDRERVQEAGGRLDLLLSDPDKNRRYEVEIMLGATDPSHIIRCIEYWDIERRRYPAYDHVAVLVAEEVTTRFLNVISLLSGTIPVIAIQMNALKVDKKLALSFVHVLKQTALRGDDDGDGGDAGGGDVDRAYWEARVGSELLGICDRVIDFINDIASPKQRLNYKKRHIGLTDGIRIKNFVAFGPKKNFVRVGARVEDSDAWKQKLEDAGIPTTVRRNGSVHGVVTTKSFPESEELIRALVQQAVKEYQQ